MYHQSMTATAQQLLEEYETLAEEEKSVFARLIWRRLPLFDSGEITDEELSAAGDALAAMLDGEEAHGSEAR